MNNGMILVLLGAAAGLWWVLKYSRRSATSENTRGWFIGPVVRGDDYSGGMPDRPSLQGKGWYFDFPNSPSEGVDYVQWFDAPNSLVGKNKISIRFRVTGGGFTPHDYPDRIATVGLEFQRRGDDWSSQGIMELYRWYSRPRLVLKEGEYTLSVPLDAASWGSVHHKRDDAMFTAALADIDNVSLVFGSAGGAGHGVFATQPSRFTLLELTIS